MSNNFDIEISEIECTETNGLEYSHLVLKFSGNSVNEVFLNTLRRIALNNIPTYAIAPECITIEENTSVFNNDQMRVRLIQLPIFNISLNLDYLPKKYWMGVDYADPKREKHPNEKSIDMYVSATNTTENIKYVTTNDMRYFENNNEIKGKYNKDYPIVLIKLRPREIFTCKLKAVLGTGERDAIWSAAGNAYYNITGNNAIFTIESHGQFSEYEILWKACRFMQTELGVIRQLLIDKYDMDNPKPEPKQNIELVLDNETHTIGGLIVWFLQNMDIVKYAGIGKKNELVKQITINVKYTKEIEYALEPILQSISIVSKLMEYTEKKIYKLGSKYITTSNKAK